LKNNPGDIVHSLRRQDVREISVRQFVAKPRALATRLRFHISDRPAVLVEMPAKDLVHRQLPVLRKQNKEQGSK
jgi:hypothetical protein